MFLTLYMVVFVYKCNNRRMVERSWDKEKETSGEVQALFSWGKGEEIFEKELQMD